MGSPIRGSHIHKLPNPGVPTLGVPKWGVVGT